MNFSRHEPFAATVSDFESPHSTQSLSGAQSCLVEMESHRHDTASLGPGLVDVMSLGCNALNAVEPIPMLAAALPLMDPQIP